MMKRIVGRHLPVEMALLGLLELMLSFSIIYAMLGVRPEVPLARLPGLAFDWTSAHHAALLAATIAVCAVVIGLYRPEICLDRRRIVLNAAAVAILAFPVALLLGGHFGARLSVTYVIWLTKVLVIWLGFAVASRSLFSLVLRRRLLARRILVVGDPAGAARTTDMLGSGRGRLFELTEPLEPGPLTPAALRANAVWAVIIAAGTRDGAEPIDVADQQRLLDCKLRGIRVYDDAAFFEQQLGRINLERIDADWFLRADGFTHGHLSKALKRLIDVVASLLLLILTFPLTLVTAILVKLDSPGPALYRQQRVGLYGKPFTLLKFRSMRTDAEAEGRPRWAAKRDPRVTRVGAFIRQTRIDELPQLFNVLRGQMSLVGPRPERPHFVEQLALVIPFYHERSYVKPGITGWAQVNFPYGASVEDARDKLSYDLYYVKNRSTLLDLLILLSTIRVILFREGAR